MEASSTAPDGEAVPMGEGTSGEGGSEDTKATSEGQVTCM